jgi:hypothetical protein
MQLESQVSFGFLPAYGSTLVGERKGIVDASLHLLLQVPNYVPEEKKFDLLVLVSLS